MLGNRPENVGLSLRGELRNNPGIPIAGGDFQPFNFNAGHFRELVAHLMELAIDVFALIMGNRDGHVFRLGKTG